MSDGFVHFKYTPMLHSLVMNHCDYLDEATMYQLQLYLVQSLRHLEMVGTSLIKPTEFLRLA